MLRVACEPPDARLPSAICQMWRKLTAHTAGSYQYATNASFRSDGRDLLAPCASLPPCRGFSRSNARGRSDLHSPNDAWTSQAHDSPGTLQDRRGMNAASSPSRQNGVSRLAATCRSGIPQQIDGLGWPRVSLCIGTRDLRDYARVPRAGWPAGPDIPPGERRWDSAPRADGTHAWVWDRRAEQLARMERDLTAHIAALETADASKWVNRQEYCSTQRRATINMNISTSLCGRSVTEAAEQRRGPLPHWKRQTPEGGTGRVS